MGFWHTCTIVVPNIFEAAHRQILGQSMDLNCITWIFSLTLAKYRHFDQSHPPALPILKCCTSYWVNFVCVGGVGV
jgi:hypothetical protein